MCPTDGPMARVNIPDNSLGQGSTSTSPLISHVWGAYRTELRVRRYAADEIAHAVALARQRGSHD